MIERRPTLHWAFYAWGGKRATAFQQHVIMGLSAGTNTCIELETQLVGYSKQLIDLQGLNAEKGVVSVKGVEIDLDDLVRRHRREPIDQDRFVFWLHNAEERA